MTVQFIKVNNENRYEIEQLKIRKDQENFIETISDCLKEADTNEIWEPVGIYYNFQLIGFAMYGLWKNEGENGRVWLDRFLIDERYQGKGYSRIILNSMVEYLCKKYHYNTIYLSLYQENTVAWNIYQSLGFVPNGELDINGEYVMVYKHKEPI